MFAARNAHKIIVTPILDVVALDYTNCNLRFWTDEFPDGGYTQLGEAKFTAIHVALRHLLNIHKGIGLYKFGVACCCTLTSAADFLFPWQGTQPAVLQLFPRYSVDIYKCTNASELISHSRSPCGLQNYGPLQSCTHSYISY